MSKDLLIIPDRKHINECLNLAKEYNLGFEYNDCIYSGDIPTLLKGSCCK